MSKRVENEKSCPYHIRLEDPERQHGRTRGQEGVQA
jgi:hypothetical protein